MVFPKNIKGIESIKQKKALAIIDFTTRGLVSSPFAAFSATKGKMVNTSVHDRNPAISENRVAM